MNTAAVLREANGLEKRGEPLLDALGLPVQ
jgi:hypothetical protein